MKGHGKAVERQKHLLQHALPAGGRVVTGLPCRRHVSEQPAARSPVCIRCEAVDGEQASNGHGVAAAAAAAAAVEKGGRAVPSMAASKETAHGSWNRRFSIWSTID